MVLPVNYNEERISSVADNITKKLSKMAKKMQYFSTESHIPWF